MTYPFDAIKTNLEKAFRLPDPLPLERPQKQDAAELSESDLSTVMFAHPGVRVVHTRGPARDRPMAVLGRQAILQAVSDGLISITPFNADHVGPASVDLTLGSTFRVFRKVHEVIEVRDHTDYRECTDKLEIPEGGHILIMPGETVLGITRERVRLGLGLCGWLEGRSRFARLGLMVHISAPFMGPGIDSQQVLEMSNFGPAPLAVVPGTLICQFIFQRMDGEEQYEGRFAGQSQSNF